MSEVSPSVCAAVRIANRLLGQLTEHEQEQALVALVEIGTPTEAAAANDVLYHQREQRRHQLVLKSILEAAK